MKLFLTDQIDQANECRQLLKLSAECAKLQWSISVRDIPSEVRSSLETIQMFIEEKMGHICTDEASIATLSDEKESLLLEIIKRSEVLKNTLGTGVVLSGQEAVAVKNELVELGDIPEISEALDSKKNLIIL